MPGRSPVLVTLGRQNVLTDSYQLHSLMQQHEYLSQKVMMAETFAERKQYDDLLTQVENSIRDQQHA